MAAHSVTTVLGRIPPHELGPTLMHEHLYCDISAHSGKQDNILTDADSMARELARFRQAGGSSVVDMTPLGLGRDPGKLRRISELSGTQIVSGIAFYTEDTYPTWVRVASQQEISDFLVREIQDGTGGVRAGLIGELASHNEDHANSRAYRLSEGEQIVFAAAAAAQRRTGVALSTHASLGRGGHAQLDCLEREGADLDRVIIGHCDAQIHEPMDADTEYCLSILRRGANCGFDLIGWPELVDDGPRAERLMELLRQGFASKIVLGTDTCRQSQLGVNGGRGMDYLWRCFLPRLRRLGATDAEIAEMLVEAPRRLLRAPA